jgi:CBS-domain-containing membrane protein
MKALDVLDSKTARVRHVLEDEADGSFIGFESPIHEAVALIATRPNSALAVMDGQGDLVGILTETDIIRGLQNLGPVILNETVASIMTKDPVIARSEDSCRDRLVAMIEGNFRNMPVYDGKKIHWYTTHAGSRRGQTLRVDFRKQKANYFDNTLGA